MGSKLKGVVPLNDRIQIYFRWKGRTLRPTLNLKPTAGNLKHASRLRTQIVNEINDDVFNLEAHFPEYKNAHKYECQGETRRRTLKEWSKLWEEIAGREHEDSTMRIYMRHINAYWLEYFGDLSIPQLTHEKIIRHLAMLSKEHKRKDGALVKGLSRKTQNNILIPLRGVCKLAHRFDKTIIDPTEGIENLKTQNPEPDPFSVEEIEIILAEARKESEYGEAIADYFEFSAFAGLRVSEQIALRWLNCDLQKGMIRVNRVRVMAKDKGRTKTSIARDVELNSRALAVLKRQRARTASLEHVFINPWTGGAWHDEQMQRRVWAKILCRAKIRYRPPKECRDTSVTLALTAGADPLWVSLQHGHSLEVMLRDYAKWVPKADRGRNLATVNKALDFTDIAVDLQYTEPLK